MRVTLDYNLGQKFVERLKTEHKLTFVTFHKYGTPAPNIQCCFRHNIVVRRSTWFFAKIVETLSLKIRCSGNKAEVIVLCCCLSLC